MAARSEPQWTTHEKNALLAEIIKLNNPPPQVLYNVMTSLNAQERLEEIPLPPGRSLNSCRFALQELRRQPPPTMTPGQYGMGTPSPMSAPMTLGKRGFPFEPANLSALAPAREIRPKPPSGGPYGQPLSQIDQPPKKKRGRPTKAEAQAKAEAQSGMAESSTAPRPPTSVLSMNTPLAGQQMEPARPVQTPVEEARPVLPPVSRMNISSMLAVTPTGPGSASHSSSSSGKRRRGRTRSDPGDVQSAGPVGAGAPITQYESPYASMGGEAITSPAQSAMLRRREELGPPAQYPPREEQPPQGPPGQGQGRR